MEIKKEIDKKKVLDFWENSIKTVDYYGFVDNMSSKNIMLRLSDNISLMVIEYKIIILFDDNISYKQFDLSKEETEKCFELFSFYREEAKKEYLKELVSEREFELLDLVSKYSH
jgi:hypothetical protein